MFEKIRLEQGGNSGHHQIFKKIKRSIKNDLKNKLSALAKDKFSNNSPKKKKCLPQISELCCHLLYIFSVRTGLSHVKTTNYLPFMLVFRY